MTKEELEENSEKLAKKIRGFEQSRSLCAVVVFFIGWYIYQAVKDGTGSVFFYIFMSVLVLAAIGILVYESVLVNRLKKEKKQSDSEMDSIES